MALQNWSYPSPCMCDWPSFPCRGGAASREALRGSIATYRQSRHPIKAAVKTKRHSTGTRRAGREKWLWLSPVSRCVSTQLAEIIFKFAAVPEPSPAHFSTP